MDDDGEERIRPTWRIFQGDTVRGVIGYLVVVAGIASVLAAAFGLDGAAADRVSSFFSSLLGVVLGFFFGRQGIDRAERETVAALQEEERVVGGLEGLDVAALLRKAEEADTVLAEYRRLLALADRQDAAFQRKFNAMLGELEVHDADHEAPAGAGAATR